jgi:hypothetical protein
MKPTTLLIIFSAAVWQPANGQERAENTLSACMKVNLNKSKAISPMLMGCFFEDINYSADGGIYAELVQNRDFEYSHSDYAAPKDWDHDEAWSVSGDMTMRIDSIKAIHPNNNHYGHLTVGQKGGTLINEGFDGISIKSGEQYEFSIYLIGKGDVSTRVVDKNGMVVCQGHFPANSRKQWKQYTIKFSR